MDSLNIESGTLQEVQRLNDCMLQSLRDQGKELERNAQLAARLRQDVGRAGTGRRRGAVASSSDEFELAPSAREDDPFKLAPRPSEMMRREKFEKLMDDSIRRRIESANNLARGTEAAGLTARGLARSPQELLMLLRGDISPRSIAALAHTTAGVAQGAGFAGIAKGASAIAGAASFLAPGVIPTTMGMEFISKIFEDARGSQAAQGIHAANAAFQRTFVQDPFHSITETSAQEKARIGRVTQMFANDVNPSPGSGTVWGGLRRFAKSLDMFGLGGDEGQGSKNAMQRRIEMQAAFQKEFAENIEKLSKNPQGRSYLANELGPRQFGNKFEDISKTVETMMQRGASPSEIAMGFRRAAGAMTAQERHQAEADFIINHDPKAAMAYKHNENLSRAQEEKLLMDKQGWNDY